MNPFKELPEDESAKAPPGLENKIFGTFDFLNSLLKVIELFMGNLLGAMLGMMHMGSAGKTAESIKNSNTATDNAESVTNEPANREENSSTTEPDAH